jgi:hypothetical protein
MINGPEQVCRVSLHWDEHLVRALNRTLRQPNRRVRELTTKEKCLCKYYAQVGYSFSLAVLRLAIEAPTWASITTSVSVHASQRLSRSKAS